LGKAFLVLAGGNEMPLLRMYVCIYLCMCILIEPRRVILEEEGEDVRVWMELTKITIEGTLTLALGFGISHKWPEPVRNAGFGSSSRPNILTEQWSRLHQFSLSRSLDKNIQQFYE
jgi:hypothetical protein